MNPWEFIRLAILVLSMHKFRSALATLGIIIGVASVETMSSIGEGAKRETLARIEVLGVDNVIVRTVKPLQSDAGASNQQQARIAKYGLLRRDLEHVRQTFPDVRYAVGLRN